MVIKVLSFLLIKIEARRAIVMTYAVAYFIDFTEVEKEMFEMQQSMLWEALDNLDKFTDEAQIVDRFREILVDEVQGSKNEMKPNNNDSSLLSRKIQ